MASLKIGPLRFKIFSYILIVELVFESLYIEYKYVWKGRIL